MRHNAEPGRHSATSSATAAMIDTRSQLNSKGTRTLALTAENGIREPTGSSIHRRTELPGFTLRYSERGADVETEVISPARESVSARTNTLFAALTSPPSGVFAVSMRTYDDVPSALTSMYADVGSVTVRMPSSPRLRPSPMTFVAAAESVLAPSVVQNGMLNATHSITRIASSVTSMAGSDRRMWSREMMEERTPLFYRLHVGLD